MKKKIAIIILVLITVLSGVGFFSVNYVTASADVNANGYFIKPETLSSLQFYSVTNTYDCSYGGGSSDKYVSYYIDKPSGDRHYNKNNNEVATTTDITIFTPGVGCGAEAWSNNYHLTDVERAGDAKGFYLHEGSIPYQLARRKNANIYYVDIYGVDVGEKQYKCAFYKLTINTNNDVRKIVKTGDNQTPKETSLNFSNHCIFLVNFINAGQGNMETYHEFNFMLSIIAYQYADVKGYLPKFNLVGHSRGGLTNMQYALDHPDMVDNLISIGTPYFGSDALSIVYESFSTNTAYYDINNSNKQSGMVTRWNNFYNALYSNINFTTIATSSNFYYGLEAFETDVYNHYEDLMENSNLKKLYNIVADIQLGVDLFSIRYNLFGFIGNINNLNAKVANKIAPNIAFGDFTINSDKLLKYLNSHISIYWNWSGWGNFNGDLFVHKNSQLGKGQINNTNVEYLGATRYDEYLEEQERMPNNKKYKDSRDVTTSDHDYVAQSIFPITHNTQIYVDCIMDKVLDTLETVNYNPVANNSSLQMKFAPIKDDNGNITSYKYMGSKGYEMQYNFTVPSYYLGKPVTEIDSGAFKSRALENLGAPLSHIYLTIPETITKIEPNTFEGMYLLSRVTMPSALKEIGDEAFKDCTNLYDFSLPSGLERIGNMAFYNTGKGSITIPASVEDIGIGAFAKCQYLESIFVNSANTKYTSINNSLIELDSVNGNKLIQACMLYGTTYNVPDSVSIIESYAFAGKTNITTINLNNVVTANEMAFADCGNLQYFTGDYLRNINLSALQGTKILNDNLTGAIVVGKVLVGYLGNAERVYLSDLLGQNGVYVSENAFAVSTTEIVVVDVADAEIMQNAFMNCSSLRAVIFTATPTVSQYAFGEDGDELPNNFKVYKDPAIYSVGTFDNATVSDLVTGIYYYTSDGALIYSHPCLYGGEFVLTETLADYSDKWVDSEGNVYEDGDVIAVENTAISLYPYVANAFSLYNGNTLVWSYIVTEDTTFTLTMNTISVNGGEAIQLNVILAQYYYFVGWCDNALGTGTPYTTLTFVVDGESNVNALYFVQQAKVYEIRIYDVDSNLSYSQVYTLYYTVNTFTSLDFDLLSLYFPDMSYPVLGYFPNRSLQSFQEITEITYEDFVDFQENTGDRYYRNIYIWRSDSPRDMGDTDFYQNYYG